MVNVFAYPVVAVVGREIREAVGVHFEWIWAFGVKESRPGKVGELLKVINMVKSDKKRTNSVNLDT